MWPGAPPPGRPAALASGKRDRASATDVTSNTRACGKFVAASMDNKPGEHTQVKSPGSDRYDDVAYAYQEWLMGFVSGFNVDAYDNSTPQIQGSDLAALDLWMRNWCNQNPTKSVLQAALAVSERDDGAVTATEASLGARAQTRACTEGG
jgi:hypothetical protein